MQRLVMLLDTDSPATLEASLRARHATLDEIAGAVAARLRLAVQLEGDPMSAEAAGDARSVVSLRGLVELTIDGDDPGALLESIGDLVAELSGVVTWPSSAVAVGTVHQVLPANSDAILLTLAASRLPSIDRKQFHDYWLHVHAPLALSMLDESERLKMGYEQVHADEAVSTAATRRAGARATSFDGVLQCSLAEVTDLPHLTVPGFAETIMKDEENFADQSAQMLGAFMSTLQPIGDSP